MEITPVEILEEILAFSLPLVHRAQAPQRTTLALVCRRWNAVVQETPIIWSKISCRDHISQVKTSLARSNRHPIDVFGFWPNRYPEEEDTLAEIRSFVELVICHIGRWRHVTLEIIRDIPLGPTGVPAPLLESLEVYHEVDFPGRVKSVTLLPRAWTPRLREVCIDGLELVQVDMPFPPTLRKLDITSDRFWASSFSKLFTILMACPGLTDLELSFHHDDVGEDKGWTTFPVVELPVLRELTLRKVGKQAIRAILQRLQFPQQCVVRLSADLCPDPSANLTSTLAHHLDGLRNGGINQITVPIQRFGSVVRAQGPRWNMEFQLRNLREARDIILLFDTEGTSCAGGLPHDRIPVTLDFTSLPIHYWDVRQLSSISNLGCIESLKLNAYQPEHVAILSHLATRITKEGAIPTWHLPGLRELHIEGLHIEEPIVNIEPVIKFVENRRGEGDRLGTPAPLQRIEFAGYQVCPRGPPDSLFELLDILDGGAQIIWYGERVRRK